MASSDKEPQEAVVKYFLCENNADKYDPPKNPNCFRLKRPPSEVNLFLIKKRLEPLGLFRYYFKNVLPGDSADNFVWEEVLDEYAMPLPMFHWVIHVKALKLEDRLKLRLPISPGASQSANTSPQNSPRHSGEARGSGSSTARGSKVETYSPEELKLFAQLEKDTHFSLKEIKTMFTKFKKEAPTLEIDRAGFALVTQGMGIKEKFLQDAIFNKFDTDRSGNIDFSEFVRGMSVMTRGSPEEKLEAAFRMYDLDGSGAISREEFLKIMESFKHLQGGEVTIRGNNYTDITTLCNQLFDEIDVDHSGEISLEEYKNGALKHQDVLKSFGII